MWVSRSSFASIAAVRMMARTVGVGVTGFRLRAGATRTTRRVRSTVAALGQALPDSFSKSSR